MQAEPKCVSEDHGLRKRPSRIVLSNQHVRRAGTSIPGGAKPTVSSIEGPVSIVFDQTGMV